jgi:hypothetical protein
VALTSPPRSWPAPAQLASAPKGATGPLSSPVTAAGPRPFSTGFPTRTSPPRPSGDRRPGVTQSVLAARAKTPFHPGEGKPRPGIDLGGRPTRGKKNPNPANPLGLAAFGKILPLACLPGPRGRNTWSVRQVFWLRFVLLATAFPGPLFRYGPVTAPFLGACRDSSPFTAAGPLPILTGFPVPFFRGSILTHIL